MTQYQHDQSVLITKVSVKDGYITDEQMKKKHCGRTFSGWKRRNFETMNENDVIVLLVQVIHVN